ncbi:MAG TPA: FAD-binding oxidoreductase [Acholeplasmataceae bacterium]|nr:FAD-binding oxidoreductase [Acholeplasmataceae bacterium]
MSEAEVIACIKYANECQMPIITRGANTGAAGNQFRLLVVN